MYVIRYNDGRSDLTADNFVTAITAGGAAHGDFAAAKKYGRLWAASKDYDALPFLCADYYYIYKINHAQLDMLLSHVQGKEKK